MKPFSEVPIKPDVSDASKPPEANIDCPAETEGWKNSIELPDDTGEWVDSIELPDDSDGWQDRIDLNRGDVSSSFRENDTQEKTESTENEKKGGSYKDVRVDGEGEKYEVHHMPADSASNLERGDGPAIKMEKADHRQTASCGMSREAREYRDKQRELIEQGKFREALQMDIDDIHEKFGEKYDDAIKEMLDYVDQLEQEGKI